MYCKAHHNTFKVNCQYCTPTTVSAAKPHTGKTLATYSQLLVLQRKVNQRFGHPSLMGARRAATS